MNPPPSFHMMMNFTCLRIQSEIRGKIKFATSQSVSDTTLTECYSLHYTYIIVSTVRGFDGL